jgi:hypothetical protein
MEWDVYIYPTLNCRSVNAGVQKNLKHQGPAVRYDHTKKQLTIDLVGRSEWIQDKPTTRLVTTLNLQQVMRWETVLLNNNQPQPPTLV